MKKLGLRQARTFGLVIIAMALVFVGWRHQQHTITAASSTEAVSGSASVINSTHSLDFSTFNSDVTIDSSTGNFAGHAWSQDLGWIAFGTTDNSVGPVTVNLTTGVVSGQARIINSGDVLNFNATPQGSNVTINESSGVFAGYAWSQNIGWVNFTGVTAAIAPPSSTPTAAPTEAASSGTTTETKATKKVVATITETPEVAIVPSATPAPSTPSTAPTTYSLSLTLVDQSGQALPNVNVQLHSKVQNATTDKNGHVLFTSVVAGSHTLNFATGRYSGSQEITVGPGLNTVVDAANTQTLTLTLNYHQPNWLVISLSLIGILLLGFLIGRFWYRRRHRAQAL